MNKVTRIIYSKHLNNNKYEKLVEIAERLGKIRTEIWQSFGSIQGIGLTDREIRDSWLLEDKKFDVPARLWKETLRDTFSNIVAQKEAAKVKVRKAVRSRIKNNEERKRLYTLLKSDQWLQDNYLHRLMRKYFKHCKTKVDNQIILDTGCYTVFEYRGRAWINVMGLEFRKRISIPLNTNHLPSGTLRLILRNDRVEIHCPRKASEVCSTKKCGDKTIGIDKGYTEVFTDSDGDMHGKNLGNLLKKESDFLKIKYQKRNKLKAIGKAKLQKRQKIETNNLGRKKIDERKRKHTANVRDKIFKAVHSVIDKTKIVVSENLNFSTKNKTYNKDQKRRLSGWVKGIIAKAIESVSQRRGSTLVNVNAAYTSQMDSRHGVLLGQRKGDSFYCFDGEVLDADINAARNILSRLSDSEIQLYTPYKDVKNILLKRTEHFSKRLGLLNPDSSCNKKLLSTESELPFK